MANIFICKPPPTSKINYFAESIGYSIYEIPFIVRRTKFRLIESDKEFDMVVNREPIPVPVFSFGKSIKLLQFDKLN